MGFFLAKLSANVSTSCVVSALAGLDCIELDPNWHEDKLRQMQAIAEETGVKQDSAPFRCIHGDRARAGIVHGVLFKTEGGDVLKGQLREMELLLSSRRLTSLEIQQDGNIASLQSVLKQVDGSCQVEIG